jgi:hypothetical protein
MERDQALADSSRDSHSPKVSGKIPHNPKEIEHSSKGRGIQKADGDNSGGRESHEFSEAPARAAS